MHYSSVSWNIVPLKCSSRNIIWFGQKESINVQFFWLLSALIKVHPIAHAIFEIARSGFIQIFHHSLVSWKTTPLHFFSSNLTYFGQKQLIEVSDFWVVGWKFTKFLMSYLKTRGRFSLNFASRKYKGIVSHDTESDAKFKEKSICCRKKDKNLVNFDKSTQKSRRFALWLILFMQSIWHLT